jgi:hypothetical protein
MRDGKPQHLNAGEQALHFRGYFSWLHAVLRRREEACEAQTAHMNYMAC